MPLTKPLGNNCLIEVVKDYEGVSRVDDNESLSSGVLLDASVFAYHLTASSAMRFNDEDRKALQEQLKSLTGKTVRWEQFAEGGQTFTEGDKTYALIPWWRLISVVVDS